MLSPAKLPIPCRYQKGEGRGRKTSQDFRKRPMGTCRPFQNGRLLIFRFLKFFNSVCITRNQTKNEVAQGKLSRSFLHYLAKNEEKTCLLPPFLRGTLLKPGFRLHTRSVVTSKYLSNVVFFRLQSLSRIVCC